MRIVKLIKMVVEEVPAYRENEVQLVQWPAIQPLEPVSGDETVEWAVTTINKPVMDLYHITRYGERKSKYIVFTPEVEEMIGSPCDLMHKQREEIQSLKDSLWAYKGMRLWDRVKFLFGFYRGAAA